MPAPVIFDYGPDVGIISYNGFNITYALWNNPDLCTFSTCPKDFQQIGYIPNLAGNVFYLALFALILIAQIFFGIRYRTWGFLGGMVGGLLLEILGYLSRVELHENIFSSTWFKIYLVGLTIAPAFLSASIYLCLSRIIVIFGRNISRFRPAVYTITFICFDIFSLILQAAGGAIAASSDEDSQSQTGVNIMIAGLAFQVVSLFLFMSMCTDFAFSVRRNKLTLDPAHAVLRGTAKFKAFLLVLFASTLFIFIRSCYRVAELQEGFDGKLANQEVSFMILEGLMILLALIPLTFLHPGVAFQGSWNQANFKIRASKDKLLSNGAVEKQDQAVGGRGEVY
ncbi:hypothetical protein MMC29_000494 [Sticta canariensis]|nr:hypothetical protein [Sticta canariensis]